MGGVPAKLVDVLAFDSFEAGRLHGVRHEVRCGSSGLLYSWDSEKRPAGYISLADTLFLTDPTGEVVRRQKFDFALYPEGEGWWDGLQPSLS